MANDATEPTMSETLPIALPWSPIALLPPDWEKLTSLELPTLSRLWAERRERLVGTGLLKRFHERLAREWSIETGVIEGLYSLDRGTTNMLIEHGIDETLIAHGTSEKTPRTVAQIIRDQRAALEDVFSFVSGGQPLTNVFIRNLHKQLTSHQFTTEGMTPAGDIIEVPMTHGEWKLTSNNPTRPDGIVHEYCPPMDVQYQMDLLVDTYRQYEAESIPPEIASAWLHHRFTQIHPFQDGNGRVARALGSISLLRAGWFPLVVRRDEREHYIKALEHADDGDLASLVDFIVVTQKNQFLQALALAHQLDSEQQTVTDILAAISDRASEASSSEEVVQQAVQLSLRLGSLAYLRFQRTASDIAERLSTSFPGLTVYTDVSDETRDYWFRGDTIEAAKTLRFFAAVTSSHSWAKLSIRRQGNSRFDLVVTFSPVGRKEFGVMAAVAFVKQRSPGGEEELERYKSKLVCDTAFQFNGLDMKRENVAEQRFEGWLRQVEVAGLEEWRKSMM